MNRREFTQLFMASAATAATPVGALAKTATPAAATGARASYAWAVAMAKAQNRASVELLSASLKVPVERAQVLYARLLERGVITAPDALGVSRAVDPLFRAGIPVPAAAPVTKAAKPASATTKRLGSKSLDPMTDTTSDTTEQGDVAEDTPQEAPMVDDPSDTACESGT